MLNPISLYGHSATGIAKVSILGLPGEKILETTMETGNETIRGKIVKI